LVNENLTLTIIFVLMQKIDGIRSVRRPCASSHDVAKRVYDMKPRHGVPVFIFVSTGIDDGPYVFERLIFDGGFNSEVHHPKR
jgi:hypothetical protein